MRQHCRSIDDRHAYTYNIANRLATDLINIQLKRGDRVKHLWPTWEELKQQDDTPTTMHDLLKSDMVKEWTSNAMHHLQKK